MSLAMHARKDKRQKQVLMIDTIILVDLINSP